MVTVRLATYAMRTRFELVLVGKNEPFLRAAGEEALREIVELERLLSRFRLDSDVGRINRWAAHQPVRVDARTFRLLQQAIGLSKQTDGAFDITVGGWWSSVINQTTKAVVGSEHILLDEPTQSVRLRHEGIQLDLGGIGKGYALERAALLLREAGVENAFLHGGTSSAFAFGRDEEGNPWRVAISHPLNDQVLTVVCLDHQGLSVSAAGQRRSTQPTVHPRTGEVATGTQLAAVVLPSPTEAEAWSTALLILGFNGLSLFQQRCPQGWALVVDGEERAFTVGARENDSRGGEGVSRHQ